jgi:hypothetical protein
LGDTRKKADWSPFRDEKSRLLIIRFPYLQCTVYKVLLSPLCSRLNLIFTRMRNLDHVCSGIWVMWCLSNYGLMFPPMIRPAPLFKRLVDKFWSNQFSVEMAATKSLGQTFPLDTTTGKNESENTIHELGISEDSTIAEEGKIKLIQKLTPSARRQWQRATAKGTVLSHYIARCPVANPFNFTVLDIPLNPSLSYLIFAAN